jgi:hypothetical protein
VPDLNSALSRLVPRARRGAETFLLDTCTIAHNPHSARDSTLNQTTGVLTPPSPATTVVYTGPCRVAPSGGTLNVEAGSRLETELYDVQLPSSAAIPAIGDKVTINASTEDPTLVNAVLRVIAVERSTVVLIRRLQAELVELAGERVGGH